MIREIREINVVSNTPNEGVHVRARETVTRHPESEKDVEKYLRRRVKDIGGVAVKYIGLVGMPDRLVMLPGGYSFWVEIKSEGKKPRKLQLLRFEQLRRIGQRVYVADKRETIDNILRNEIQGV